MDKFIVYTDGGARGNPGPAAIGVVIQNAKGEILKEYGEYLGETTNNEAEYRAPISALKKIKSTWGKAKAKKAEVQIFADSELLIKQLNGEYKVENPNIQKFFLELWNLKIDFHNVTFTAIPRGKNKEADRMVNEALDRKGYPKQLF
jgi:ribonuclease HI